MGAVTKHYFLDLARLPDSVAITGGISHTQTSVILLSIFILNFLDVSFEYKCHRFTIGFCMEFGKPIDLEGKL